jgi:hypothetical protein
MRYLLVTSTGSHIVFHTLGCAEIFKQTCGGQIHVVTAASGVL